MDTVISFTPEQLFGFITAIGTAIVTCGAVVTLFIKMINKMKAPETEQNQRIKDLEEENKARKEEIRKLNSRLQWGDNQFREIEKSNKIILKSLQALLRHSLGIADSGALTDAMNELDDYLLDK